MSEQDVLKPQFTLEQLRKAKFQLLSQVAMENTAMMVIAAVTKDSSLLKESSREMSLLGAIATIYPEIIDAILLECPDLKHVKRQIGRFLKTSGDAFNDAAIKLLTDKMKD